MALKSKIKRLHGQIMVHAKKHQVKIRFLVVGVWNTAFGYLAFYFLDTVLANIKFLRGYAYLPATILSNAAGLLMAYSLHRVVTFRSKTAGKAMVNEFLRFAASNFSTVALGLVLMPFVVEVLGLGSKLAGFIVMFVCALTNYLAHSRVTFSARNV